jgi:hypothetical protein
LSGLSAEIAASASFSLPLDRVATLLWQFAGFGHDENDENLFTKKAALKKEQFFAEDYFGWLAKRL